MKNGSGFRGALVGAASALCALTLLVAPAGASSTDAAKTLVITKRDVGSSYTEQKAVTSPDSFGTLATCVGKPAINRALVSDVQGSEFNNATTGAVIFSSVQVVKTRAMAKADRAVLSDPKFPNCVAQLLTTSAAATAHLSGIRAQRVTVKGFGDYSTAVLILASGKTTTGSPTSITQIEVGVVKGRAEMSAGFTTHGTKPFDRRAAEAILGKVSARMARAKVS